MWASWRNNSAAAAQEAGKGTPLAGPYPTPLDEIRSFALGAIEEEDTAKRTAAIHLCCAAPDTPTDLLRRLIQVHPKGLQQRLCAAHPPAVRDLELLPLHRALFATASLELVSLLLDNSNAYGIKERAGEKLLPLHIGEKMCTSVARQQRSQAVNLPCVLRARVPPTPSQLLLQQ